jgi:hypothetical protein
MLTASARVGRTIRWSRPVLTNSAARFCQDPRKDSPKQADAPKHEMFSKGYFQDMIWKNQLGVLLGGSAVGFVIISNLLYSAGDYFVHLSSGLALYYGFTVGAVATGATATGTYLVAKSVRSDPEAAIRLVMNELRKNKDLANVLGPHMVPGEVKTYASTSSGFGVVGARPKFFHPQVHLAFQLKGSTSPAVVTAVCTKRGLLEHKCQYVGVDWTTPAGQILSLTVLGEESTFGLKNTIRDHLKLLPTKSPKFR